MALLRVWWSNGVRLVCISLIDATPVSGFSVAWLLSLVTIIRNCSDPMCGDEVD